MTKVIRLTEDKLYECIEESVRNVLSELDWKTYMNYSKGRRAQGNLKKAREGEEWARKNFNDKHFPNHEDGHEYAQNGNSNDYIQNDMGVVDMNSYGAQMNLHQSRNGFNTPIKDRYDNHEIQRFGGYANKKDGDYSVSHNISNFGDDGLFHGYSNEEGSMPKRRSSSQFADRYNRASKDLRNYYSGQSKYIRGKGWED